MIGIDLTKISRFERMKDLPRFAKKLNITSTSAITVAKTWACLEALVKAEGKPFDFNMIQIEFPKNSAPKLVDVHSILSHSYALSLSHDGDLVVAVAIRTP
jgi:phosphopantetheinyl transferase (holo-ACP synthase)